MQHDLDIEDASWHSELCGLQLDKVLKQNSQTLNGMKERLLQARHGLDELRMTGHELVAKQVNEALEAFYAAGITRDKSDISTLFSLCLQRRCTKDCSGDRSKPWPLPELGRTR